MRASKIVALVVISVASLSLLSNAANVKTPNLEKDKKYMYALFNGIFETYIGNKDAKINLFVFSDYNCPDCKSIATTLKDLVKNSKDIKVVYIDYPILRRPSNYAAFVAYQALKEGKYQELHDAFMEHKGKLSSENEINNIAEKYQVDISKIEDNPDLEGKVLHNLQLGHELGITNVPTIFIGNAKAPHNVSVIVEPIPAELIAQVQKYLQLQKK